VPQRRRHFVVEFGTSLDNRASPPLPWIARRRIRQFEELHEDPSNLATDGIALTGSQALDLLGDVLAVEAVVAGFERAQHLGLVLSPGVEIVVVARSVGHRATPSQRAE
jgi:hypothetical protein